MSDTNIFPVPASLARDAWVNEAKYDALYGASMADPAKFWGEEGKRLHWIKPYTKVKDVDYKAPVHIRWFYDGTLNVSANCLDRHLAERADQTAIIWEGDSPSEHKHISYGEAYEEVCR